MRREGLFMEFVSFINNPDGTPLYENTVQYAILKREWKETGRCLYGVKQYDHNEN
jgi:hypothetical protein